MRVTRRAAAAANVQVDDQADPVEIEKRVLEAEKEATAEHASPPTMIEPGYDNDESAHEEEQEQEQEQKRTDAELQSRKSANSTKRITRTKRKDAVAGDGSLDSTDNFERQSTAPDAPKTSMADNAHEFLVDEPSSRVSEAVSLEALTPQSQSPQAGRRGKKTLKRTMEPLANDTMEIAEDETTETDAQPNQAANDGTGSEEAPSRAQDADPTSRARPASPSADTSRVLQPKSAAKRLQLKEKLGMRSTSNKENLQPNSMTPTEPTPTIHTLTAEANTASAPSDLRVSEQITPSSEQVQRQDPIEAIDALEDAIEKVDNSLPKIGNMNSPQKPNKGLKRDRVETIEKTPRKADARMSILARSNSIHKSVPRRSLATATGPITKTTVVSKSLGRSGSIKHTPSQSIAKTTASSGRLVDDTAAGAMQKTSEKTAPIIPHSKPRPISLSFPTPPRPPKSKPSAPPTFKLPGEAIAAKLKAAKEARMKREEEVDAKKPTFKARPAPKTKEVAAVVRQTSTSMARQSLVGKPVSGTDKPPLSSGLKRASSVRDSTVRPRPVPLTTSQRMSMALGGSETAASKRSSTVKMTPRPKSMIVNTKPRASTAGANATHSPSRSISASMAPASLPHRPATNGAKGTVKGKEVFRRAALEQADGERQKKEKEEAAKKARAAAAEKGRLASREWAEKQKSKKAKDLKNGDGAGAAIVA